LGAVTAALAIVQMFTYHGVDLGHQRRRLFHCSLPTAESVDMVFYANLREVRALHGLLNSYRSLNNFPIK